MSRWQWVLLILSLLSVVGSALGLVYLRQESRTLFVQQQELNSIRDETEVEWGRLQLEQATLADIARIERIARDTLAMREPTPQQVIITTEAVVDQNQNGDSN